FPASSRQATSVPRCPRWPPRSPAGPRLPRPSCRVCCTTSSDCPSCPGPRLINRRTTIMPATEKPHEHWESRDAEKPQMWSGRVNAHLPTIAGELTPGRALDLGCGEGADAIWLATNGWQVVAVDIATNALDRARGAAEAAGVVERIDFQHHDLSDSFPA